jgi:hypothetical protein
MIFPKIKNICTHHILLNIYFYIVCVHHFLRYPYEQRQRRYKIMRTRA